MDTLKTNLARLKKESGLTLEAISKSTGIPLSTVSFYTTGAFTYPNTETLAKLAEVFGVTLAELFIPVDEQPEGESKRPVRVTLDRAA